jgi:hypothetical protein
LFDTSFVKSAAADSAIGKSDTPPATPDYLNNSDLIRYLIF